MLDNPWVTVATTIAVAIEVLCAAAMVFISAQLWRNQRVSLARKRVLDWCDEAIGGPPGEWERRIAQYEAMPDYHTMLWRWWVPVDSFLPDEVRSRG